MLTRDQIVKARLTRPLPLEKVSCPEWAPEGIDPTEAFVYVRTLTAGEKDAWENAVTYEGTGEGRRCIDEQFRAKLAAATVCDAGGSRLFTEADVELLGQQDSRPLSRIAEAAMRLNAISTEQQRDLLGNSGPGQPA
jgi:hypothetical protein